MAGSPVTSAIGTTADVSLLLTASASLIYALLVCVIAFAAAFSCKKVRRDAALAVLRELLRRK